MAATEPLPPLTFLSKETIKRLLKDVKEIIANPLVSHGIHYKHHDTNLLKGHALIIGPRDTPYAGGYYLFEFIFFIYWHFSRNKKEYLIFELNTLDTSLISFTLISFLKYVNILIDV